MYAKVEKSKENKSRAVANAVSQKKRDGKSTFRFEDDRPEAIQMRKLQEMANNRSQAKQVTQLQDKEHIIQKKENNPAKVQLTMPNKKSTDSIQRRAVVNVVSDNPDKKKIRAEGKVKDFKGGTKAGKDGWIGVTAYRSYYEISNKKYRNTGEVGPFENGFTNPEAGHVLGAQNGGDGGDSENVFAQDGGTNNGKYKQFENEMRRTLDLYSKNADVKFTSYIAGVDIEIGTIADEGLSDAMSISSEDTDSD